MSSQLTQQQEIQQLCAKPLEARTPEEFAELLQSSYNSLCRLTNRVPPEKDEAYPLTNVGVLGRLTEPKVHEWHFRFDKPDLDLSTLVWNVSIHRYQKQCPAVGGINHFEKWFPYLMEGHRGGYGNMRDWGHEAVNQYSLKLTMFPTLMKTVQAYRDLIVGPYSATRSEEQKQFGQGISYMCSV